jgi:hypothetical protein
MKRIPLTKGAYAMVDDADYERVIAVGRWCLNNVGYAIHWYTDAETGKRRGLLMHRFIMEAPSHLDVDHIDTNRINNVRANMRLATKSENQANKNVQRNNTSSYKGVVANRGKWEARVGHKRRKIHLIQASTPEIAAMYYDAAARLLYGDFARVNFPDKPTPSYVAEIVRWRIDKAMG